MNPEKYPVIAYGYGVFIEPDGGYIFPYEEHHGIARPLSPCEDLNVQACAILEQCTGSQTVQEVVSILERKFEDAPLDLFYRVESFLDAASTKGYISYSDTPTQIQGLLQGSTRHHTPSRVLIEITANCNLRCGHCLLSAGESLADELTAPQIISILEHFFEMGVKRVSLSGGELFTKKGWEDLVHFCSDRFYTSVLTNGTLITEETADKMTGLNEVHISLYGADAETHEKISNVKGSFEKAVNSIKLLTERGVYVGVSVLMVPFNLYQLEDMVQRAISLKCSIIRIGVVYPFGRARNKEWVLTESQKTWLHTAMVNLQKKYREIDIRWEEEQEKVICGAGFSRWAVASNGEVYPCSVWRVRIGDLVRDDPVTILMSPAVTFLQKVETPHEALCGNCPYLYVCKGCHGQAFAHASEVNVCRWAQQFEKAPKPLRNSILK